MAPIPHRARYHRGPCGWRRIERGLAAGVGYRARAAKGSTTAAKRVVKAARTLDLSDDEIRAKMRCDKCGGEMRAVISAEGPHPNQLHWECLELSCDGTFLIAKATLAKTKRRRRR